MSSKQWALSGNAENVDWSDIAQAGRAYADNLVGEPVISKFMHIMADEIERLRGTTVAPLAWAVIGRGMVLATSSCRADAEDMQAEHACDTVVTPLYGRLSIADSDREPVAWAVVLNAIEAISMNGGATYRVTANKEEADRIAAHAMAVVPLYERPTPPLTDVEREALAAAAGFCEGPAGVAPAGLRQLEIHAATIRGLLERTK